MKTEPYAHQLEGQRRLRANPTAYALGAEQGTGKTWMLLDDMEHQLKEGRIQGALVIAPKGVHVNWVTREMPTHMSVPYVADFWLASAGVKHKRRLEKLVTHPTGDGRLVVLTMNVDALATKRGKAFAERFLKSRACMMVIDESQRIKNPAAARSKAIVGLRDLAVSRRIASGTLVANTPIDLFGQYQFLDDGLLGTRSYRAFVAEYAELLPYKHPLVQQVVKKSGGRGTPQILARDAHGRPRFRNLEKLSALMSPHTYRVLKEDCLDLPPKIYQTLPYELSPKQRRVHDQIRDDQRLEREDGEIDVFTALTVINKLQQVTSGFIMIDGVAQQIDEDAAQPRIAALLEAIEDADGKVIVWVQFWEEIRMLNKALTNAGRTVVEYYGPTSDAEREEAVDRFQNGDADVFLATRAAETGLTLTAASTVIYYSWGYSLEGYLQSQDRAHRIGTHRPVVYINIVARDTIDERVAESLQAKEEIACEILNNL